LAPRFLALTPNVKEALIMVGSILQIFFKIRKYTFKKNSKSKYPWFF
jgi:hypothetical protein